MNKVLEFIAKNYSQIISVSINILTLLALAIMSVKNKTLKFQGSESVTPSSSKFVDLVKRIIPQAIMLAENSGLVNGEAKLTLAKANVLLNCDKENIKYDEEFVEKTINDLIYLTKQVNKEVNKYG